jgi:hypothetical protein
VAIWGVRHENQEKQQQSTTVLIRSHQELRRAMTGLTLKLDEVTDKLDGLIGAVDSMRVNFDRPSTRSN